MKKLIVFIFITLVLFSSACSDNQLAKNNGGTMSLKLAPNRKLINVTWKEPASLWVLTRNMKEDEKPESYEFKEHSAFGYLEGTVIVTETSVK